MTPMDIHHKEFKTARFGGYNEEEVDSFLDMVADELEKLIGEGAELRQQQEHLSRRLAEFEEMQSSLQSALLAATKSAEAMKEQARQESEAMTAKAQEESDGLIRSAQEQARQMILRAQNERQKMERENSKLAETRKRYLHSIRDIAGEHLRQVTDWESREIGEAVPEELPLSEDAQETPLVVEPPVQPPPEVVQAPGPVVTDAAPPAAPASSLPAAPAAPEPPVPEPSTEAATLPRVENVPEATPATVRGASRVPHIRMPDEQPRPPADEPPVLNSNPGPGPEPQPSLVDEVLAIDGGEEVYSEFLEGEPEDREKGRKGKREKRDKHFFWE